MKTRFLDYYQKIFPSRGGSLALVLFLLISFLVLGLRPVEAVPISRIFLPIADSYVIETSPSANYGTSTQIRVDGSPLVRSYLKFNVENISGQVVNATLRIFANSSQSTGFSVHKVSDNTWIETGIVYTNAPSFDTTSSGASGPLTAGNWYTVDITSLISGNGTYSIALLTSNTTAESLASRESANAPQLTVVEETSVTPTPTPTPSSVPTPTPTTSLTPTPTSSPQPGDVIIAAVGDMVCGAGSTGAACKQMEVSNLILAMNPQAFLALGDVQYESGEYNDFINFYEPSYGRLNSVVKPSVGNHEYNDPSASGPTQIGYWDYFNGIGNFSGVAGDRDKGYYSFDLGDWHMIALNTNCSKAGGCGVGSPQETWLRSDLAQSTKSCTLAYYHHPLYSSGGRATTGSVYLWKALYDYHADVILTGHDHTYERFAYMDANGNLDPNGIREFVVGTGGRNHTHFVSAAPNSEVFDDTSFGALKMILGSGSYNWEFVPIPGNTFVDSGSNTCHSKGSASPTPTPTPTLGPTPAPTPTPPVSGILTFFPIADAHVLAGNPTINYGSLGTLEVDGSPLKKILLKFNVSGIGTSAITSAKLRLYDVDASNFGGNFHGIADTSWIESMVTWNTAPAFNPLVVASLGSVSPNIWYEVDVTPLIIGDGIVSIGIDSSSTNGADYSSKEGTFAPQLVISLQ